MITLLFLVLLTAFELAYISSKQQRKNIKPAYLQKVAAQPIAARSTAGVLLIVGMGLFVIKLGFASGTIASIVSLMAAGSLVVSLQPLNFLRGWTVAGLFTFFFVLELFI